jgi:DNA-binding NarL/FixJ family response regulator
LSQQVQIRVLLLDDEALLRQSLAQFLASEPDLCVVGECGTPLKALEILASVPVDVVLLDFAHAVEAGGRLISTARGDGFQGRFLVVSESAGAREAAVAFESGASGVFLKM